jgi:hypothetical protein
MSRYTNHESMFIPAAMRAQYNTHMERLGFGPDNFSIPMSPSGRGVPTHYACSWVMTDSNFRDIQARLGPVGMATMKRHRRRGGQGDDFETASGRENLKPIRED